MASLPTGTVTFLFTDIEGSTALWDRHPAAMAAALERHNDLVRLAIEEHGGSVFKTMGDAFCAVFATAPGAVAAAASAQAALHSEPWPVSVPLLVRMALHTGTADERAGDYFGPPLNRISRLLGAAHGGQTLLSEPTYDLVRDSLTNEISLLDLGEHRLRDLTRPERIFQLVIRGVPATFPPIRSSDRPSEHDRAAAARSSAALEVYTLGQFRVVVDGRVLPDDVWRRRKARQLFKYLLTRPSRRLAREEAVEQLWPDSDPEAAATNLRSAVHALRRALGGPRRDDQAGPVVMDREMIGLRPELEVWVDSEAFLQAIAQSQDATDPSALLQRANELYAGDYLPEDVYEDWASERRESLKRSWIELQVTLARRAEAAGDPEQAATALERLFRADACDERAAQELMRLYARHGRRSDALRVYQRLVEALRNELQVEPSHECVALHRQISAGQPATERVASALPTAPPIACPYPFPAPPELIGREIELAALQRILQHGRTAGHVVLLGAPAGTGKSALAGALVRLAEKDGVQCLAGACYEQEGAMPFGPFADALAGHLLPQPAAQVRALLGGAARDLARAIPELRYHLDLPELPPAADPQADRLRLFGAIHTCLRALAQRRPVLLCLEDLHAADAASLQLVHYLARHTRRLPLTVLGTLRTEDRPHSAPLSELLTALSRERLADQIRLPPLDSNETAQLVANLLDGPASDDLNQSLFSTTEGNPLFVEQLVMALREGGRVDRRGGVWHGLMDQAVGLPTLIREVISQRLARLSDHCRETLSMAAVLGRTVSQEVLQAALQPIDESELLADLEQALDAHLLAEAAGSYTFRHALVREAIYQGLSAPRRTRLHARAAETLERLAGARALDQAAELAHHFGLGGAAPAIRARALTYSLEAGRRAAALSAHREALGHFSQACSAVEQGADLGTSAEFLAALEGRGYAERELAMWRASATTYRQVLALSDDPLQRARARGAIGYALHHTIETAAALAECDAGLAELATAPSGRATEAVRLRLQASKTIPMFISGRFRELEKLGHQMLLAAESLGEPRFLIWAHSAIGTALKGLGRVEQALHEFELALASAERADDKVAMAIAHENLGIQCQRGGRLDRAHAHLDRALSLYRDAADESRAVLTLQTLGRVWLAEGELGRAYEQAELGRALAADAQDRWAAECHDLLGAIHSLRSEWEAAEASFNQALAIREVAAHAAGQVDSLLGLGLVHQRKADWTRAAELYARAVSVAESIDPSPQAVAAWRHQGRLLWLRGDEGPATARLKLAFDLGESMPESIEYPPTLLVMAELHWRKGDLTEASDHAERALACRLTAPLAVEARVILSRLALNTGGIGSASKHAQEALRLAERLGAPRLLGMAHLAVGRAKVADKPRSAAPSFQQALRFFESAGTPYERGLALLDYGQAAVATGDIQVGRKMIEESLALFEQISASPAATEARRSLRVRIASS